MIVPFKTKLLNIMLTAHHQGKQTRPPVQLHTSRQNYCSFPIRVGRRNKKPQRCRNMADIYCQLVTQDSGAY